MIFNKTVFKKLLKEAYKGAGLLVANKEGRIIIAGGWWVMTMEEQVFTKEGKAALVELTGQLPMQGECWRSTSAGNQIEMPPEYIDIDGDLYDDVTSRAPFEKTIVTIDGLYEGMARMYQKEKTVVCINEVVEMLLDPGAVQPGEDGDIVGPYTRNMVNPSMFYWYTGDCSFAADRLDLEKEEYKELLENMQQFNIPKAKC